MRAFNGNDPFFQPVQVVELLQKKGVGVGDGPIIDSRAYMAEKKIQQRGRLKLAELFLPRFLEELAEQANGLQTIFPLQFDDVRGVISHG